MKAIRTWLKAAAAKMQIFTAKMNAQIKRVVNPTTTKMVKFTTTVIIGNKQLASCTKKVAKYTTKVVALIPKLRILKVLSALIVDGTFSGTFST